jgi:hypothetical protein
MLFYERNKRNRVVASRGLEVEMNEEKQINKDGLHVQGGLETRNWRIIF